MRNPTSTSTPNTETNLKPLNRSTAQEPHKHPVRVLQFGEGNFLRAFVDWMIDIMNEKAGFDAGVQIVQPIPHGMGANLNQQDGLYHVVLNGMHDGRPTRDVRLVTCVTGVVNPFEDFAGFLTTGENPGLRFIVSNTTEAGITFDPTDTDPSNLAKTFPGKLTQLLFHRYKFFDGDPGKAPAILPCELIEKNGEALRDAILQYTALWSLEDGFTDWIKYNALFCNTLVDRIVPGFPKDNIDDIRTATGYHDQLAVMAEWFHLWVIEPCNPAHAKALEQTFPATRAGLQVKIVDDLTPYRTRKVRILNGAHTAMVPVAYLHGLETVRDAVEHPLVGDFVKNTIFEEIIPTLDLSRKELDTFANAVIERFRNPYIRHELLSIALNSISKFRVRVLPSLLAFVERKGALPDRLIHSLAALIRFYKGEWRGKTVPLNDDLAVVEALRQAWQNDSTVETILSDTTLWHTDLTAIQGLTERVKSELKTIESMSAQ